MTSAARSHRELAYADLSRDILLSLGEFNDNLARLIRQELDESQLEMRDLAAEYENGPIDQPLRRAMSSCGG